MFRISAKNSILAKENTMQYLDLKKYFKDFTVFSLTDVKRIDAAFHRRRLNEWQDKGHIKKIIRGYYIFSDLKIDETVLFETGDPFEIAFLGRKIDNPFQRLQTQRSLLICKRKKARKSSGLLHFF